MLRLKLIVDLDIEKYRRGDSEKYKEIKVSGYRNKIIM